MRHTDAVGIDVGLLGSSQCAYRTTPATAGVNYRMTCGVSVVDYASITLAFLDDGANTLATRSTEMVPGHSGASSVTLTSPPGTV